MRIYERIEQRVALPGDSETRRSQKTLSTILLFAGGILTIINMVTYLSLGMTTASIVYIIWVLFILSAALLILIFPRSWLPMGSAVIIGVVAVSLVTNVFSGGFQAGLEAAIWMLLGPIAASLFIGPRFTIVTLSIYVLEKARQRWARTL